MTTTRLSLAAALLASLTACAPTQRPGIDHAAIADEINRLAADDQHYDRLVMNSDPGVSEPGFFERKRRLQIERTARIRDIFADTGFPAPPAFDAGTSSDFWLLVQHSDNDPGFQQRVLDAIGALPPGVVSPSETAYLVDRVRMNTDRPQVYGTQVDYDFDHARAFPKRLEDPTGVDARRASVGLAPLSEYMNEMSELSFRMNRAMYEGKGVTEPWRYEPGYSGW